MAADLAKKILGGGTFIVPPGADGSHDLVRLAMQLAESPGQQDAWHAAIADADLPAVIAAIGALESTEDRARGRKLEALREAALAHVQQRLSGQLLRTIERIEEDSTRLTRRSIAITVMATFVAVFVALWGQSVVSERATKAGVGHVLRVASAEATRSRDALSAVSAEGFRWDLADETLRRTMLDPLPALGTLLRDVRFLERGDREIVIELLAVNTAVSVPLWSTAGARKSGGSFPEPPALDLLRKNVSRAEELLRKQIEEWSK